MFWFFGLTIALIIIVIVIFWGWKDFVNDEQLLEALSQKTYKSADQIRKTLAWRQNKSPERVALEALYLRLARLVEEGTVEQQKKKDPATGKIVLVYKIKPRPYP